MNLIDRNLGTVEAVARAMCISAACDPDAMTYPGVLTMLQVDGMQYTIEANGFQKEDAAPAWTRFTHVAMVAIEAISKAHAKVQQVISEQAKD